MTGAAIPFQDWRAYRIIAREALVRPIAGVSRDTLISNLGLDSFQLVALCVALEEAFRVTLPCADIGDARTAGDLVRITAQAVASQHPPLPQPESKR